MICLDGFMCALNFFPAQFCLHIFFFVFVYKCVCAREFFLSCCVCFSLLSLNEFIHSNCGLNQPHCRYYTRSHWMNWLDATQWNVCKLIRIDENRQPHGGNKWTQQTQHKPTNKKYYNIAVKNMTCKSLCFDWFVWMFLWRLKFVQSTHNTLE